LDPIESKVNSVIAKIPLLKKEIQKVIIGQEEVIDEIIIAFLAGGHCLLEGVPGLAKTLLVKTIAKALKLSFSRIQFTPDLMPTDIIGTEILEEDHVTGKRFFQFNKGPLFANIVLADEINRTPPKTQAALLEAMQEFAVTYAGKTYPLGDPFFILATQNPIEQAGTYPLPEAQLDRFLLYIKIRYPTAEEEFKVLASTTGTERPVPAAVIGGEDIVYLQSLVREVFISDAMINYVNQVIRATRPDDSLVTFVKEYVRWGAGPRAGQALILTAKARALFHGRFSVTLDDLQRLAYPVLRHRILLNFKADADQINGDMVTAELLKQIVRPSKSMHE